MSGPLAVVDASAMVDLLLGNATGEAVQRRLRGSVLSAPAHLDAEVLSALGRLQRSGLLTGRQVAGHLATFVAGPIRREPLSGLLRGAWRRRDRLRLADALYVELGHQVGAPVITTDARLARATSIAEVVAG